jgi:hypothetical protein
MRVECADDALERDVPREASMRLHAVRARKPLHLTARVDRTCEAFVGRSTSGHHLLQPGYSTASAGLLTVLEPSTAPGVASGDLRFRFLRVLRYS